MFALPLWYFAFADSLTFNALLNWEFGAIAVIVTISATMGTKEAKLRAFTDKFLTDKKLKELQDNIENQAREIKKKDPRSKRSIKFIKRFNKDKQTSYNEIKTNTVIEQYERKVLKYRLNGKEKKAQKYERKIAHLKQNPLFDKHFIPYDLRNIINVQRTTKKMPKKKGNNEINNNPTELNWFMTFISMLLRGGGVGLFGSIPIMFNESAKSIFFFYLSYIAVMSFTIVSQYMLTTWKMENSYLNGLETIDRIQQELLDYLAQPQEQPEPEPTHIPQLKFPTNIKSYKKAFE